MELFCLGYVVTLHSREEQRGSRSSRGLRFSSFRSGSESIDAPQARAKSPAGRGIFARPAIGICDNLSMQYNGIVALPTGSQRRRRSRNKSRYSHEASITPHTTPSSSSPSSIIINISLASTHYHRGCVKGCKAKARKKEPFFLGARRHLPSPRGLGRQSPRPAGPTRVLRTCPPSH